MSKDTFGFSSQMEKGMLGVKFVKSILRSKYPKIVDYEKDMTMQKLGIDLYVDGLGFVEVKTDLHDTDNFYFEISTSGSPGAIFNSSASWFAILFPKLHEMWLIRRSNLQYWLAMNLGYLEKTYPERFKTITSNRGSRHWSAKGVIVPRSDVVKELGAIEIKWTEEDEMMPGITWE